MLLAAIAAGAFFQSNRARFIAVFCFVFTAVLHGAIGRLPFMESQWFLIYGVYYVSEGLFNLLTVYVLHKINHVTRLVIDLQIICLIALGLNAYGYVVYMSYLPTDSYREIFPTVYWLALIALLRKDDGNVVGDFDGVGILGGITNFLRDRAASLQHYLRNGEKT